MSLGHYAVYPALAAVFFTLYRRGPFFTRARDIRLISRERREESERGPILRSRRSYEIGLFCSYAHVVLRSDYNDGGLSGGRRDY